MTNKPEITKIFNRHIGKVLEACDQLNMSPIIKQGIKSQLWMCHDDIQKEQSKELEINGNKKN